MVDVTSPSRESLPYVLSVLAFTFLIRLCWQTASIWAIAAVPPVFVLVLFLGNRQKTGPYHPHSLRTAWYDAMINFLYVFTLLYLTDARGDLRLLDARERRGDIGLGRMRPAQREPRERANIPLGPARLRGAQRGGGHCASRAGRRLRATASRRFGKPSCRYREKS